MLCLGDYSRRIGEEVLPIYEKKKEAETALLGQQTAKREKESRFDLPGNQIYFISLGCPRNLVDTEVMMGLLLKQGYEVTDQLNHADYIVINTCGFLEAARQESSATIYNCRKEAKQKARLIVTGCMVQNNVGELKSRFPEVDYFLGSGDVLQIVQAVESQEQGAVVTEARSYLEAGEVPRTRSTPPHYAYLKIAEGCRKRCSYCIIPAIKGPLKSKSKEQVKKEFDLLLKEGTKEIILIAQDLGDYGKDNGWKGSKGLSDLLKELLNDSRDFWIRLLYLYPDEIDDELIELMASDPRLLPYIDMPIQHIDDLLLKAMRRTTSQKQICETIEKLRKKLPDVTIRTSLIAGFPGETEKQHQALLRFIEEYRLDNVGVFAYSREPGSHADKLPDHLPEQVKDQRCKKLMKAQEKVVQKKLRSYVGRKMEVIVDGLHPESPLIPIARHKGQCPNIDGLILIVEGSEKIAKIGDKINVIITGSSQYDLLAKVV